MRRKIDAKDLKLLELKQAKVNAIKCLRKFTDFSKSNIEDILNENFEIKKRLLMSDLQVKILKVALLKEQAKSKKVSDNESFD